MCHEAVDEGRVDSQRYEKANALNGEAADDDGQSVAWVFDASRKISGMRTDDEERICWEDPYRCHACDCEGLGRPSEVVSVQV